jgi:hypothetical protein
MHSGAILESLNIMRSLETNFVMTFRAPMIVRMPLEAAAILPYICVGLSSAANLALANRACDE